MIIISAHADKVRNESDLSFVKGVHSGLLDNFIGVLVTYLALYDTSSLRRLCSDGKIQVFHSLGEEFGVEDDFPKVTKEDTVVVVDLGKCDGEADFILENFYNWSDAEVQEIQEFIDSEKLSCHLSRETKDDDEGHIWSKYGCKTVSFCIPIQGAYHSDIELGMGRVVRAREALKRILCHLVTL